MNRHDLDLIEIGEKAGYEKGQREAAARIERLEAALHQIAWLAQRPYDPHEQLTGGEDRASEGQAGSEA